MLKRKFSQLDMVVFLICIVVLLLVETGNFWFDYIVLPASLALVMSLVHIFITGE